MKKWSLALALILGSGWVLINKDKAGDTFKRSLQNAKESIVSKEVKTEKSQALGKSNSLKKSKADRPGLVAKVLDTNLPSDQRLAAWSELDQALPDSAEALVTIAISSNPFAHKKSHARHEEHTESEYRLNQEESFRILSLQSLENAVLAQKVSPQILQKIIQNAKSDTLRSVAKKIAEYATKGLSYSEMSAQAIAKLKVPE